MEAHVIGFNMWVKAAEKAQFFEPDKVIPAMIGVSVPNLTGGYSTMMPNHHITKPVYIGEIQADGQLNTVWQTPGTVVAQEWSPYLEGSKDLIADWRPPMSCGNFNVNRQVRRLTLLPGPLPRPPEGGAFLHNAG
jgi:urea transport system substrate-binding protein